MSEDATLDEFVEAGSSVSESGRVETSIGQLPSDWRVEWLNEVCDINPDGFSENDWTSDTFEYISLSNVSEGEILQSETTPVDKAPSRAQRKINEGDVLVGTVRPKQVSHGFVTAEHDGKICSSGFGVLRPSPAVHPNYLIQEVLSHRFFRQMEAYVAGSGYPAVKIGDLKRHRISVPPVEEQRKIASTLYNIDQAIQKTEEVADQLETVRRGTEQDVLSRGVQEDGTLRPDDQIKYRSSWVGEIPRDWEVKQYSKLISDSSVGIVVKPSQYYDDSGTVPILRSKDISRDGIVEEDFEYMTEESNTENENSQLQEGDVITVRSGDPGLSCVVPAEFSGANCADLLISTPGPDLDPHYAAMWINSFAGRKQIDRFQAGLAQKHFNLGALRKLRVGVPPLDEQKRIVEKVSSISETLEREIRYKNQLQRLKRGLMQDLLSGTVRTTDTNIEVLDEVAQHG